MNTKKIATFSMLLALSVALSLIESMVPFIGGMIPGVKLGLANTVIIFAIYMFSFKDAITLSMLRVFLLGIIKGTIFTPPFYFSLSGAVFSIVFMILVKKYTKLSIVGVSIVGAVTHSIGQILMVSLLLNTFEIVFSLPLILLFSVPTGIVVGLSAKEVMKIVESKK
jgi:heptaprenyl diphosphate synthase